MRQAFLCLINSKHVFVGTSTQFAITKAIEMAQPPPSTLCHAIHHHVRPALCGHSSPPSRRIAAVAKAVIGNRVRHYVSILAQ